MDLLSNSDFITIHVPLNETTRNLIDNKEFKIMKNSAFLINASRGGVVNEEALYHNLKIKNIEGAALDVFNKEPNKNIKLVSLEEVLATPHIGGTTVDCVLREGEMAIDNILNFFENKSPIYIV